MEDEIRYIAEKLPGLVWCTTFWNFQLSNSHNKTLYTNYWEYWKLLYIYSFPNHYASQIYDTNIIYLRIGHDQIIESMDIKWWGIITDPCLNFNGGLTKMPFELGHRLIITYHKSSESNYLSVPSFFSLSEIKKWFDGGIIVWVYKYNRISFHKVTSSLCL